MNDIDNMTEAEIKKEAKELHNVIIDGNGTPSQARRLTALKLALQTIKHSKSAAWWL